MLRVVCVKAPDRRILGSYSWGRHHTHGVGRRVGSAGGPGGVWRSVSTALGGSVETTHTFSSWRVGAMRRVWRWRWCGHAKRECRPWLRCLLGRKQWRWEWHRRHDVHVVPAVTARQTCSGALDCSPVGMKRRTWHACRDTSHWNSSKRHVARYPQTRRRKTTMVTIVVGAPPPAAS